MPVPTNRAAGNTITSADINAVAALVNGNESGLAGKAPLAHASAHAAGGTDALTPDAIGAALSAHGHDAGDVTSGLLGLARVAPGTTINFDKAKGLYGSTPGTWPTSRPSTRTDITVVWTGDTDPGTISITGDKWDQTG